MKKDLRLRAEAYAEASHYPFAVRFSTTIPDARYSKSKYFFIYLNTEAVAESFKTQRELEEFLSLNNF